MNNRAVLTNHIQVRIPLYFDIPAMTSLAFQDKHYDQLNSIPNPERERFDKIKCMLDLIVPALVPIFFPPVPHVFLARRNR
jgi:hypothetical protein